MDKLKIGIPRSLFFYHDGNTLCKFFQNLDFEVVISPKTNRLIFEEGMKYANDEMCMSLKVLIGHVSYLTNRCDYVLIPRIDNYGVSDQTCTNFLALYDKKLKMLFFLYFMGYSKILGTILGTNIL